MADEQKPQEPKNRMRWSTKLLWFFGFLSTFSGCSALTYYTYKMNEMKPFYETFATRAETAMILSAIEDAKNENKQGFKDLKDEMKAMSRSWEERYAESQKVQQKQELDIANIQFILKVKSN